MEVRVSDLRSRGHQFETHPRRCVVSSSKTHPLLSTGSIQENMSGHD